MTAVARSICKGLVPVMCIVTWAISGCGGKESLMREPSATDADEDRVAGIAADWRWKHRLLVVATESQGAELDGQWMRVVEVRDQWLDRDLLLILLTSDEGWIIDDPSAARSDWSNLSVGESAAFRRRYDLAGTGFEAVLVGKDGGVKSRYSKIVDPAMVFPFIDAMPMRMDEMRKESE
jgi:hypothetical protein